MGGEQISRHKARQMALLNLEAAERSRAEFAEREAKASACPECPAKDKKIAELEAEARDQRVRADTSAYVVMLARNALDNSGSGYPDDDKGYRLHHGINHLSHRAHDAEAQLAEKDKKIAVMREALETSRTSCKRCQYGEPHTAVVDVIDKALAADAGKGG